MCSRRGQDIDGSFAKQPRRAGKMCECACIRELESRVIKKISFADYADFVCTQMSEARKFLKSHSPRNVALNVGNGIMRDRAIARFLVFEQRVTLHQP